MKDDLGGGAWIALAEGFVSAHEALMSEVLASVPLRSEPIRIFGREVLTPRLTSYHGDPGAAYRYSGRTFTPAPWPPALAQVREALHAATGAPFNAVLVNHYRDGQDAMGWHADDEPELGPAAPDDVLIASVSLGARRRFLLRPRRRSSPSGTRTFDLGEGNLLVMGGSTQRHFHHRVPPTSRPCGPRMNLTFRIIRA